VGVRIRWKSKKIKLCRNGNSVAPSQAVEQTLMPVPSEQLRSRYFVNTIQVIEDLVDRVFRRHDFTSVPSPPPTLRLVMEDFPELEELQKAA
jgi:hypothetical protein